MNLFEVARRFSPTTWVLGAVAALSFLLVTWWLVIGGPVHDRKAAAAAKASAAYAASRSGSAADASNIADQIRAATAASEDLTRKNADEIRAAPGADVRLNPALNDAGRRGMCRRPSYRRTAECVQLLGPEES